MNVKFLKSPEKKKIVDQLQEQFGIEELPYLLLETGKEKIRGYSGHLSKEEILEIGESAHIEIIGLYILKEEQGFRLSFDATQLLAGQIKKQVVEINDEQLAQWMKGNDLQIALERGTYAVKHNEDFVGCGKSNGEVLFNYVPKDRRVRR